MAKKQLKIVEEVKPEVNEDEKVVAKKKKSNKVEVVETPIISEEPEIRPKKRIKTAKEPEVIVEEVKVNTQKPKSNTKKEAVETPFIPKEPEEKKKRKKKLSTDQVVEEIIKANNLPVYEKTVDMADVPPQKLKRDKKQEKLDRKRAIIEEKKKQEELEKQILKGDHAAYVQVIKEKGKVKKVIRYNTDLQSGLTKDVVIHRESQKLTNEKSRGSTKSVPTIILSNTFTFFNLLNFAIAAWLISALGWRAWNQILFLVIVMANLIISTVQEIRSKRVIDKLSIMSAPTATVLRDGEIYDISVNEVVLDDILCLSSGKQIASDSIVVEGVIEVNESLLTGESDSISKNIGDILYAGSYVVSGNCKARVERVAKDNYIEKLTNQAKKYKKPKSDLLKSLTTFIRVMAIIILPLGTLVFMSQYSGMNWGGTHDYIQSVETTSGAVIGMIPSGLFLLTSIALAVGVIRLAQNNTLVQELYCIEMLARVDVLCLDKTGTITDGSMSVKTVIEYPNSTGLNVKNIYSAMQNVLNDNNVTSQALEEKFGRGKKIKHRNFIPFNSARKYSAVEFEKYGTFVLGAPEFVMGKDFNLIAADVNKAASDGYRVICLAHSNGAIVDNKIEGNLTPIGLILIEDTIRPDAIETIDYFKKSGVEVKVISGDNPITVSKISKRAGIEGADDFISLDGLSDREVIKAASEYTVFGRVSPAQKKLLVTTLKELGKTVAMTGDGVNDILALREADCSISLGSGSDAARNVSHLVLLDSNFGSMPKVVAEGRRVINNVQRVASLFLTKTIFSLLLALYCIVIKEYPIKTNQLLLIDMCVTGIPSFILALETNNSKVSGKFFANVIKNALPGAISIALTTAVVFFIGRLGINLQPDERTTIIVLNATFTCFTVLYKVCRPFNVVRRILYFIMITLAFSLIVIVPDMFNVWRILPIEFKHLTNVPVLTIEGGLLLICLMQATYPIIRILENLKGNLKKFVGYFVNLLRKIK